MIQTTDGTVSEAAASSPNIAHQTELDPASLGETAAAPRSRANGQQPTLSLPQILDATAECLAESGYDGTTIRRIASRLSCAVGSIYRYCTDKRALLSAVTQRRFEPVAQAVDGHVPVARTVLTYAQMASADPQQYRLMFWLASLDPASHEGAQPPIIRRIIDGWARQIGDPRAAQRLWAQLHGDLMLGLSPELIVNDLAETGHVSREEAEAAEAEEPSEAGARAGGAEALAAAPHSREDLTLL